MEFTFGIDRAPDFEICPCAADGFTVCHVAVRDHLGVWRCLKCGEPMRVKGAAPGFDVVAAAAAVVTERDRELHG